MPKRTSGRKCQVCVSKHRHQIEVGIVNRVPSRVLSARFGCSRDGIVRHAKLHVSPAQKAAMLAHKKPSEIDLDQLRISEGEGLLSALVTQRARLQVHAETAAEFGDVRGAVAAENAIVSNLKLVGQLLGQFAPRETRTTTLLVSADYLRVRAALLDALRPFPEAARAVSAALARMETEAAAEIAATAKAPLVIDHQQIPPPPC
jgi:hypothetical protein